MRAIMLKLLLGKIITLSCQFCKFTKVPFFSLKFSATTVYEVTLFHVFGYEAHGRKFYKLKWSQ
ncbi:hypothetical protein [Sulfolobus tengchongensis spindle-shaped virus 3]|nr:hypothetical protein [Sulfolobus tengchongensis spindle-shaped virus 3]